MATAQPVGIVQIERGSVSPRTSPRTSPRASPRSSPRLFRHGVTIHLSPQHKVHGHFGESSTSSTPYYHSFTESHWLAQWLAELVRKDSELQNLLKSNRAQHVSKVFAQFQGEEQKQAVITSYRDFLTSLVSLIAESVFLENPGLVKEVHDPHGFVKTLCGKKCPELNIFRRLVIQPAFIAATTPDSTCTDVYNGIPVNQLARFCDVAVLNFLNGANQYTQPNAVLWAIDYISNLLKSLHSSIAVHNSPGWYGTPATRQKKTVSITAPPTLPPMIVVGSPPVLDPETGQPRVSSGASRFPFPSIPDEPRLSPQSVRSSNPVTELGHNTESGAASISSLGETSISERRASPIDHMISPTSSGGNSPRLSPQHRESDVMLGMELHTPSFSRPRSPRLAELRLNKPQSIPEEAEEESQEVKRALESKEGEGSVHPCENANTVLSPESSDSDDVQVQSKPSSLILDKTVPDFDIKTELRLFINAEGRISLIAILQAIASLPQSDVIWTEKLGMNCFQLIQHCMDLGLMQSTKVEETSALKRRRFQKQENTAFHIHGQERPCHIHSKYVVFYAVHALIQCATNLLVGCSHDPQESCRLGYKRVLNQNSQIHPRLRRHLNRIHCHSPLEFQRVMMHFASTAPLRKFLHFLHVVLEFCQPAPADNVDSLLLSITSSILRPLVDRLTQLDLSKPSLYESCLTDVCLFFQYANTLFSFQTQLDSYRHFHMYLQRVALSVILPEQDEGESSKSNFHPFPAILEEVESTVHDSPVVSPPPSSPFSSRGSKLSQSLPRRLAKQLTTASSEQKPRPHSSIQSDSALVSKSPRSHRRGIFTKQHSIHETDDVTDSPDNNSLSGMKEWRRLKLNVLRHRIQRLVVLMDLSEPGTVPDHGMLASLLDLSDGTLVVARAMVLLECALFVHNLREKNSSRWLCNKGGSQNRDVQSIAAHLKKWAVAIGEKLRIIELRERDMIQRLRGKGGGTKEQSIVLPEEPVLPDSQPEQEKQKGRSAKFQTVSFGIKMCACILLYEITHYLRDNAYNPPLMETPRVSVTNLADRRLSVVSSISTDTEAVATPSPNLGNTKHLHSLDSRYFAALERPFSQGARSNSLEEGGIHSTLSEERIEEVPQEAPQKKVLVYLQVNSGGESAGSRGRANSALKQTVNIKSSPDAKTLGSNRRSSISASVGRRHVSFYEKGNEQSSRKRPSAVTVGTSRPIPGKQLNTSHSFKEDLDSSPTESLRRSTLQPQASTASQRSTNLGAQIQHGISRLATRARAFRGKIRRKTTADPRKTSRIGSGNSPNLMQQRKKKSSQGMIFGIEDNKRNFPWLDIVEHLVVVDALNPEAHASHIRTCTELVTALNHVYALQEGGEGESHEKISSLNSMFTGPWHPFMNRDRSKVAFEQSRTSQPRRMVKAKSATSSIFSPSITSISSSQSSNQSLASLNFTQIQRSVFSLPSSSQCSAIELFLEQDSVLPEAQTNATFNKMRKGYIHQNIAGLVHAPFSLLVYTAPILTPSSFSSLKELAWEMILDRNQELAQASGVFFLLAAAKEKESTMKEFFNKTVERAGMTQQQKAVLRFMALWKCRYKVWPALGEKGQKRFNLEREGEDRQDQQTIGYSLPANLLSSAGRDVPVAPWTALSLCVHHDCDTNPDKCYRDTRLAPLKHCKEVSEAVESFSVSGISLPLEADSKTTSVFAGVGSEDNAGNININQWEAVEPTLFPPSLLALINFVISSLTPHSSHTSTKEHSSPPTLNKSELAYQAMKQCMIEDPRLLFRPLLNRFNRLYQDISDKKNRTPQSTFVKSLKDTLHPLHTVLQSFLVLPPKAAHFLFNSFVGIITRHTDQPCTFSSEIIQSVLALLTMVIPSVRGLDLKALKSVLKKESCYTTILTTARIRGTERINIIDETSSRTKPSTAVIEDMIVDNEDTFGQIIARFKGTQLSFELLQNFYLVDQSKDLPVLNTLVVKDHYSMLSDRQYPTFILREVKEGRGQEVWSYGNQLNQLFIHKMSEVLRVLMSQRLLATGPDVERGSTEFFNKFAQPNYQFLHQELVALTSFPRQALTSIFYETGPAALVHSHLRSCDSMLMGTWVKFVLDLFIRTEKDYDWGNSMALFLNVVNGALLLYSEDLSILRQGLAALIVVASKFVHVFRKHGYEMVVPTLIQVYASHMNNTLITDALKFVWGRFYLLNLDSNVFLLQAIAATATLLSEEAAKLSTTSGGLLHTFLHSQQLDPVVVQHNNARAVFQLLESLEAHTAPPDHLHIMSYCPLEQETEPWRALSLQTTFYLCITIASWNPEAVRGMQVLVFLDHLIPMFLKAISLTHSSSFALDSMRSLVKGCDSITKPQSWKKGDFLSRRETQRMDTQQNLDVIGGDAQTPQVPRHAEPQRRSSAVAKIYRRIVNPTKTSEVSDGSAYFVPSSLEKAATSALPPIGHQEYVGEFKRRLQATNQRVLQLSRESLLSLTSKFVLHETTQLRQRSESGSRAIHLVRMDSQTTMYLTTIAVQLLKLGGTNEVTLTSHGLCCFMESLIPNVEWTDAHLSSFHNIISRLVKLFRMLCRVRIILSWESLGIFLKGVTQCIRNSPQLAAHEHIFIKLKMLLEVIVNTPAQGGGVQEGSPSRSREGQRRPLLHFAPSAFNDIVVRLASQLIVTTKDAPNPRLCYHMSDLVPQKLMTRDAILPKILLPLCIHLGLREDLQKLPQEELNFLLQLFDKKVKNVLKLGRPPIHPSHFLDPSRADIPADMFFRAIKVFCCAFSESFTLHDWSKVSQWVMSLSLRKLDVVHQGASQNVIERTESASSVLNSDTNRRSSRLTSLSSQTNFDSYLAFYKALLVHVYEGLLLVHHIPLFSFLWPLLERIEFQLNEAQKSVTVENPAQLQSFRSCTEKCQVLRREGQLPHTIKSKTNLLLSYQDEMKSPTTQHKFKRASTTVDRRRQRHPLRRKLSHQQSLPSIGEENMKEKSEPADVEVERKGKMRFDSRPTFLKFSSPPPEEGRGKGTAVVMKGEHLKKKPTHVPSEDSITKVSSLSDRTTSRQTASQPVHQKKSPLKKHTNPATLSPLNSPPTETSPRSKRRHRKTPKSQLTDESVRNPPLSQLKNDSKFTSSEFQADVEDFDVQTPQPTENIAALEGRTKGIDGCVAAVNEAALQSELDLMTHPLRSVTVEAEVHFNPQVHGTISHEKEPSISSLALSPSLIPPPPSPRPSSRSGSRPSSRSGSPHPSLHSPSPHPSPTPSPPPTHSPPSLPDSAPTRDSFHSQDLDFSKDFLIPRPRTDSSPPHSREESPLHDSDTETDTDSLLPRTQSSASGAHSRKALSPGSPTSQKKRLSFERRQGSNSKSSGIGTIFLNMPGVGRESDC